MVMLRCGVHVVKFIEREKKNFQNVYMMYENDYVFSDDFWCAKLYIYIANKKNESDGFLHL